jgi:hypothetical protein
MNSEVRRETFRFLLTLCEEGVDQDCKD